MLRPLASRSTLCTALAALALLAACSPGSDAGAGAPRAVAAAASAPGDAGLAEELERLERAAPAVYQQQLRARAAQLPAGSAEQLDVLALRGLMAAYARDRPLCDQIADSLRRWPAGALRANAVVAAAKSL